METTTDEHRQHTKIAEKKRMMKSTWKYWSYLVAPGTSVTANEDDDDGDDAKTKTLRRCAHQALFGEK